MERSRLTRYLRIAVIALSLTACVLLVALWVRSYSRWDSPHGPFFSRWWIQLNSVKGHLFVGIHDRESLFLYRQWNWRTFRAGDLTDSGVTGTVAWVFTRKTGALGFGVVESSGLSSVFVPYWFLVALAGAAAASPWWKLCKRFSLRTLLIATTLVAVGLGIVIAAK